MEQPGRVNGAAIRLAGRADRDGIEAVERAAFSSDQLSRRSLRHFLAALTTTAVVATAGAEVLGYAMVGFRRGSMAGRVFTLAVRPDAGRRGLGRALLDACEVESQRRGASRITLEVRADNAPARQLYASSGYAVRGTFLDYYEDGTAAVRLEKSLGTRPHRP